jgi:hypothetical protein
VTARDALAAIRARAEAATEGPWWGGGSNRRRDAVGLVGRLSDRGTGNAIAVLNGVGMDRVADAQFIAHARTDVPKLVEALEAVLAIHKPEWTSDHHGSGYYRCSADHWTLDDQTPSCPTVTAIETALEDR